MAGAPKGNRNSAKGAEWRDAIRYEVARIGREIDGDDPAYLKGLRKCAQEFIKAAEAGEMWALKELGDRTDGKATQAVEVSGPQGGPLEWSIQPVVPIDRADEENPQG